MADPSKQCVDRSAEFASRLWNISTRSNICNMFNKWLISHIFTQMGPLPFPVDHLDSSDSIRTIVLYSPCALCCCWLSKYYKWKCGGNTWQGLLFDSFLPSPTQKNYYYCFPAEESSRIRSQIWQPLDDDPQGAIFYSSTLCRRRLNAKGHWESVHQMLRKIIYCRTEINILVANELLRF